MVQDDTTYRDAGWTLRPRRRRRTLACSSGQSAEDAQQANAKVALPTYTKYEGVTPDWAGDEIRLDGFTKYPAEPTVEWRSPRVMARRSASSQNIPGAIPPQLDANPFWQELNQKIGSDLVIEMAPNADYGTKFQTKIASGDLPDLINIPTSTPDLPGLLEATCMDLTEHVSGDAIAAYPYLANLGPDYWRGCVAGAARSTGLPVTVHVLPQHAHPHPPGPVREGRGRARHAAGDMG